MSSPYEPITDDSLTVQEEAWSPDDEFLGGFDGELGSVTFEKDDGLDDVIVGDGACHVCGSPTFRPPGLTKAGSRKRVPKYCDLHTGNVSVSAPGPSTKGMGSELRRIQEELSDDIRLLGILAGQLFPVTGFYLVQQADPFTAAIIKLAKNNQRVLRVLHRAATVAPIYTVAETVAGAAYAVQVDTRNADAHNMIAKRLGVSTAYDALYGTQQQTSQNGSANFTPPPRYS